MYKRQPYTRRSILERHTTAPFKQLNEEETATFRRKGSAVYQYNTPSHVPIAAMAKIKELKFEVLPHSSYSPDLPPSNSHLFPNIKIGLVEKY